MRPVEIYTLQLDDDSKTFKSVFSGIGVFHGFGVDYEEFESGPGNFSTAIVEMPDGTVKNVPADMIKFRDIE